MGVELCAVEARHFQLECHQAVSFDVAMSELSETTRGVKRKIEDVLEIGSHHCRMRSRQSVFHLSVYKLNVFRQSSAKACLLRSVLVWNTLRRIQCEMEQEGIHLNLNPSLLVPPDDLTLDSLPNSETVDSHREDYHAAHSMSNFTSVCYDRYEHEPSRGRLTPLARCSSQVPHWSEHETSSDRLSSLNWSSLLSLSTSSPSSSSVSSVQSDSTNEETSLHTLMPPPHHQLHTSNNNNYTSSGSSGSEEIFGDIDLSLYDFDLLSPLSPPHLKLAPVSAEELMKSLSASEQASYFRSSELLGNEDHVTPVMT